jgi:hypothetical protein
MIWTCLNLLFLMRRADPDSLWRCHQVTLPSWAGLHRVDAFPSEIDSTGTRQMMEGGESLAPRHECHQTAPLMIWVPVVLWKEQRPWITCLNRKLKLADNFSPFWILAKRLRDTCLPPLKIEGSYHCESFCLEQVCWSGFGSCILLALICWQSRIYTGGPSQSREQFCDDVNMKLLHGWISSLFEGGGGSSTSRRFSKFTGCLGRVLLTWNVLSL